MKMTATRPKTLYDMLDIDSSLLSDVINVPEPFNSPLTEMAIKNRCGHMFPYYQTVQEFKAFASYWFSAHQLSLDHLAKIIRSARCFVTQTFFYISISFSESNKY